jgi:hypothetical protein
MSKKKSIKEIELKDKCEDNHIHLTPEQERRIVPKEVKNLHYVLNNYPHINKYSWEIDGERVKKYKDSSLEMI